jgi:hypothetical protein
MIFREATQYSVECSLLNMGLPILLIPLYQHTENRPFSDILPALCFHLVAVVALEPGKSDFIRPNPSQSKSKRMKPNFDEQQNCFPNSFFRSDPPLFMS